MQLRFNRLFHRERLIWSDWSSPPPALCSYCAGALPEVPVMMWNTAGDCAAFCDPCVETYIEAVPLWRLRRPAEHEHDHDS